MSDSADEDLLNGEEEFDYESYDLGYEEEEALLEDKDYGSGDEEEFKSKQVDSQKKEASSETEEPEDVLNLGIEGEEDFQDVDEKTFEEETPQEKKESKFTTERPASSNAAPPKVLITKKPVTTFKKTTDTEKTREAQFTTRQLDNRRRRGVGRNNFQPRPTYDRDRNNMVKDRRVGRRNGTVYINPKYEGVVEINENNARLAWDNPTYPQNNGPLIQPWASGNNELNPQDPNASMLLNNLVGIAATFAQSPNLLQVAPSQPLNFEPPANIYQNVPNMQPPFNNSGQVLPSQQTSFPSYQSSGPQQYGGQPPLTTNYNYYNNSNPGQNFSMQPRKNFNQSEYENRNDYYNRVPNNPPKSSFQNNYFKPEYQSGSFGYNNNQNKNSFYGHSSKTNQNTNHNFTSYESRNNANKPDGGYNRNFGGNYNRNYNSDGHLNFNNNRNVHNRPLRQIVTRNEPNNQQNFNNPQSNNANQKNYNNPQSNNPNFNNSQPNKNLVSQNNKQQTDVKSELPEKRVKLEERPTKVENQEKTEPKEQTSTNKPTPEKEQEEDEEMRLYRLKIEEQKRERERVLKMKEERRRMMLQQKENEKTDNAQTEKKPDAPAAPVVQNSNRQQFTNKPNFANTVQKQNYQQRVGNQIPVVNSQTKFRPNAQSSEGDFPNLTFKISNTLLPKTVQTSEKAVQQQKKEQPSTTSLFMSQRVVVVKNKNDVQKGDVLSNSTTPVNNDNSESADVVGQGLSSFFNNRKVLKKDNSLINTRLVVVNNLSASTTQNKLVAMTRGIGDIQKLRMDNQERQATILFKSVASAHAFFKKYQRHMLDLSMIEVKLEPMI